MLLIETNRLVIRHFTLNDTAYILRQLNEKSFIKYIADKQARSLEDAENYLKLGPLFSYKQFGFGLNIVLLKGVNIPIGMCGLLKRDELQHPDLGFAFLPEFWNMGYAIEACKAVIFDARTHNFERLLGVTLPENHASNNLLVKLNFISNGEIELYGKTNNLYEYMLSTQNQRTLCH